MLPRRGRGPNPGHEGRILRIVNTLEQISFNFGPTLLEWMEGQAPATYAAVLAADRNSVARLGHGNAVAMPYHHAILPLSTRREKVTEVRWGIADFRRRFGREPEGCGYRKRRWMRRRSRFSQAKAFASRSWHHTR